MALMERLAILIDANGTAAVSEFRKVGAAAEKDLGGAEAGAARLGGQMQKAGGIAVVGGALILGAMAKTAEAYDHAEAASLKLENSVQNNSKTAGNSVEPYKKLAKAIEDTTAISHVSAEAAAGQLVQMKLTQAQITEIIPLVADYAQKTGQDMADAALQVGKAVEGQTKGLKAHGIVIDDAIYKTNHFAGVMDALNGSVKGAAAQFAGTFAGQLEQTKNKLKDVEEGVGKGAVKAFGQWLSAIQAVTGALDHLGPGTQDAIGQAATWAGGLATVGGAVMVVSGSIIKYRVNLLALKAAQQEQIAVDGEEVVANTAVSMSFGTMALAAAAGAASFAATVTAGNALIHMFDESSQKSKDTAEGFTKSSAGAKQLAHDIDLVKHATTGKGIEQLYVNGPRLFLEYKGSVHDARQELAAFDDQQAALATKNPAKTWYDLQQTAKAAGVSIGDLTASMPKTLDAMAATNAEAANMQAELAQTAVDAHFLGEELDANGKAVKRLTDEEQRLKDAFGVSSAAAKQLVTDSRALIDAQFAARDATNAVIDTQDKEASDLEALRLAKEKQREVTQGYAADSYEAQQATEALTAAQEQATSASATLTDAKKNLDTILHGVAAGSQEATDAIDALTSAEDTNRSAADAVLMAHKKLRDALRQHGKHSLEARIAQDDLTNSQDAAARAAHGLTKQQATTNDILHGYPATSKQAEQATRQFESALHANTSAQKGLEKAAHDAQHILHGYPATSKEVVAANLAVEQATKSLSRDFQQAEKDAVAWGRALEKLADDLKIVNQEQMAELLTPPPGMVGTTGGAIGVRPNGYPGAAGPYHGAPLGGLPPSPFTGGSGTISEFTGSYGGKSGIEAKKSSIFGDHNVINFGHVLNPAEIEQAAAKLHNKVRLYR